MKKRTVGIYAKYDASEQSLCALFLASYIATRYRYVTWFTSDAVKPGNPAHGFSHQWDADVCSKNKQRYSAKIKDCDTFFFLEPDKEVLEMITPKTVTSFVLNPYDWSNDQTRYFARKCDNILLLSPEWLPTFSQDPYLRNIFVWPFKPLLQGQAKQDQAKHGDEKEKELRLFYPAYGFAETHRQFTRDVAELVKACRQDTKGVVGFYDNGVQPEQGYDARTYDWRLQKYLQQSDWIIDLNPQPLFGFFPSCAGSYGLRWMGFGIPPYTDIYSQTRRHLITVPTQTVGRRTLRAVPDVEDVAMQIVRHIETVEKSRQDVNQSPGSWERRCGEFLQTTNHILGIRTKY